MFATFVTTLHPYELSDTQWIFSVSSFFISVVIVNAYVFYTELVKNSILQKRNLENEIKLGGTLQRELVPASNIKDIVSQIYGQSKAAKNIRGDYIHKIEVAKKRMIVDVEDVIEHNIE